MTSNIPHRTRGDPELENPGAGVAEAEPEGRFAGSVTFLTGGASGIGRATAARIHAEDGAVVVFDVDAGNAEKFVRVLVAGGVAPALAAPGDVRDPDAIRAAVHTAQSSIGQITHLVNAAGVTAHTGLMETTDDDWQSVLDVNLKGAFLVSREVAPALSDGGCVVNVASIEGHVVFASGKHSQPHYCSSKGGIAMLTRALAHELGPRGIRVNSVSPALVATPMLLAHGTREDAERLIRGRTMIPRLAEPEEIASAITFLLSEDASYITGTDLPVDGGWLAY
jgi:NAD(P)-dependent dehydrogenase (short-subunit alcohol dehydrogenase family)